LAFEDLICPVYIVLVDMKIHSIFVREPCEKFSDELCARLKKQLVDDLYLAKFDMFGNH
jgi:hypothetical protein